jgi:signal transduction histidine kinase
MLHSAGPEVPVILAAHTSPRRRSTGASTAVRHCLARVRRALTGSADDDAPSPQDALVRALCHDMHGALSCLDAALHRLGRAQSAPDDVLAMAQAQVDHLTSMLRTAEATGGAPPRRTGAPQPIAEVVTASLAASGLPRRQLTVALSSRVDDVLVGDARLQRILVNLLENAHRHGDGAAVTRDVSGADGWVELVLSQDTPGRRRVADHLGTTRPPADLTGLGLWSVQQQARELGGRVVCDESSAGLTLRLRVPDR